jgi:hypothetical protein
MKVFVEEQVIAEVRFGGELLDNFSGQGAGGFRPAGKAV